MHRARHRVCRRRRSSSPVRTRGNRNPFRALRREASPAARPAGRAAVRGRRWRQRGSLPHLLPHLPSPHLPSPHLPSASALALASVLAPSAFLSPPHLPSPHLPSPHLPSPALAAWWAFISSALMKP